MILMNFTLLNFEPNDFNDPNANSIPPCSDPITNKQHQTQRERTIHTTHNHSQMQNWDVRLCSFLGFELLIIFFVI
jgi:hypothetical protein